ncbi:MAG: SEL1-like repeat protein [Pseudolabrys sp.]|nr:SEL1-like repeat protein [Pseudolabrys sp.]
MRLGWSVKGIRPEARETAKEAARRAGMPLSEWLNTVIVNSAAEEGVGADGFADDDYGSGDLAAVNAKLDSLNRRLDRLGRVPAGPEAYAPPHLREAFNQSAAHFSRVDHHLGQMAQPHYAPPPPPPPISSLDRAVAEIAARQRALNGAALPQASVPAAAAPARATVPTQDLSGLEEQLHRITEQIETLRKPGVEEAIQALRAELAEMGHSVSEAMPRQALDHIERQIQGLTQRIAEGRAAGVDTNMVSGLEHGIAEVRDVLRTLTPAESLHGFQDALIELANKIDTIVAQKDPATLQQLEHAIMTLRGIAGHIASNETVGQLAEQVATLAEKVDHIANAAAAGDALANLENRINAISEALAERSHSGGAVPVGLEALVNSLTSKIEQLQASRGDSVAVGHLEDRIVKLVEKLDASDSRLNNLEVLERGLADLLLHLEEIRSQKGSSALRAEGGVDSLKQDLARTQKSLDAVNGRLAQVVDRLAQIEHSRIAMEPPLELGPAQETPPAPPVFGKLAVRAVPQEPQAASEAPPLVPQMPKTEPAPMPPPPPVHLPKAELPAAKPVRQFRHIEPIEPGLPPDEPLEPGSGPPRRARQGARIALTDSDDTSPASGAPQGKSGFLAAARRAAKAALKTSPKPLQPDDFAASPIAEQAPQDSMRTRIAGKIKALFVSASVIAIVVGGLHIGANQFDLWGTKESSQQLGFRSDTNVARDTSSKADTTASITKPEAIAPQLPGMLPPTTALGIPSPTAAPAASDLPVTGFGSAPLAGSDVTGSITRNRTPGRNGTVAAPLPNQIGSASLRQAANDGDAGAAYEIAVRFAEGRGVPANSEEAVRWFERAANAGVAPAQFRLGSLYEKGHGVKKDLGRARALYNQAAAKGNAKAMHNLAVLYAEGIEGKPDYALAAQWFRKAAMRGVSDSQYNLGVLCARGLGTEKNLGESYKWFALAAAAGDAEAGRKRDEVATRLDPKALSAAEQSVKTFKAEPQPAAAVSAPTPDGGWDKVDNSAPAARGKPKAPGTFEVGAR